MTWKKQLEDELNALAARGVSGDSEQVSVLTPAGPLGADIAGVDAIGCALRELALHADALATASIDELKTLSEKLSQQINYLMEPISPIEIDSEGATVQMRSNPPQKDDDGTKYYELLVRRDGLTLCRYRRAAGQTRQVVPANLTREVLARLAGDFVDAV